MDFGLWEIDFGLCKKWTLDFVKMDFGLSKNGLWTFEKWTLDFAKMDFGLPKMDFDVRELLNSSFEVIITSPV